MDEKDSDGISLEMALAIIINISIYIIIAIVCWDWIDPNGFFSFMLFMGTVVFFSGLIIRLGQPIIAIPVMIISGIIKSIIKILD